MTFWLAARHCGVTVYTLRWWLDATRSKSDSDDGEMTVRTAKPTRDLEHLTRLLANDEQRGRLQLQGPTGWRRLAVLP